MLANPRTVRVLNWLVKEKSHNLIFLMKTKCDRVKIEYIKRKLKFKNFFVVDNIGRSGGLAMSWNEDVNL